MAARLGRLAALVLCVCAGATSDDGPAKSAPARVHMEVGQVWAGNYSCGHVPAWLLLHVVAREPLEAVFHFAYPNSGTHGAFLVKQRQESDPSRDMVLDAHAWLFQPENTEMVGLEGSLSANGKQFHGSILHESCQDFDLARTTVDLAPAASGDGDARKAAENLMQATFDRLEVAIKGQPVAAASSTAS